MDVNQRRILIRASALMCLLCFTRGSDAVSQTPVTASGMPDLPPAPKLAFSYAVGQTTTYTLSSEATRSVQFEGIRPDDNTLAAFDSAVTGRLSDVTWTQTVQAVDPNGQALLRIEIKGLAYKAFGMGDLVVDYDSTRAQNAATALEELLGGVYHIRVDVKGNVSQVLGKGAVLARLNKDKPHFDRAGHLLSERMIKARHTIKPLNTAPDHMVKNETWTSRESFVSGNLGRKEFEKRYVCQGVDKESSLVKITMTGSESVDESISSPGTPTLPFTSEDQFTGALILDTRAGQIKMYRESLEINWSFVDPASIKEAQPRTGHMIARQAFLLERKESVL